MQKGIRFRLVELEQAMANGELRALVHLLLRQAVGQYRDPFEVAVTAITEELRKAVRRDYESRPPLCDQITIAVTLPDPVAKIGSPVWGQEVRV